MYKFEELSLPRTVIHYVDPDQNIYDKLPADKSENVVFFIFLNKNICFSAPN